MGRSIRLFPLFVFVLFLVFDPISAGSFSKSKGVVMQVTNTLDLDRAKEMVALKWDRVQQYLKVINCGKIYVYDSETLDTLITQCIDKDQNGIPEELIFCSDFKAKETKRFVVKVSDKQTKTQQSLTFAQLMIPREDLAWENDRIAFRIYGPPLAKDVNNGIDVWTKRVRYPIIEKWYKGDEAPDSVRVSYHEDHGEGADFFSVGRTLGAGGSALYDNGSLCQPGVFMSHKILAAGPIRAMLEVVYKPVKFNGHNISEVKRFTLDAGSNLNKIEITYRTDSLNISVQFAAGLVKRKGVAVYSGEKDKWIGLWGLTNEKEENGLLGTGIAADNITFNDIKEDSVHVLLLGTAITGVPLVYYAGAGWTCSGDFSTVDEWNKYLNEFILRLKSPLKITTINK